MDKKHLLVPLFAILLPLSSCANHQKALRISFEAVKSVSQVGQIAFHDKCMPIAQDCASRFDRSCLPLRKCHADRRAFMHMVIAAHKTIALARMFLANGEGDKARKAIRQARGLIEEAERILCKGFKEQIGPVAAICK